MTDENLRLFLQRFREFNADIEARKKRGQNDFNPLLCVQKLDDEENMHSGFLYALLNPYREHYQDDLFLKLFVKSIGLQEWFGSTSGAEVYKEKKRIDIHITNGTKHIIVENKIWAKDQDRQIARYIEAIAEVDSSDGVESNERESNIEYENIAVVYLAPYIKEPEAKSLGKWKIQGESLVDSENNQVRFKAISYKNEIIDWLKSALNEAGGISNLRMAIECYTDVVKRLTGQKENTMGIEKFLTQDKENTEIMLEILHNKEMILESYCKKMIETHKEQIDSEGFEIIETSSNSGKDDWDSNTWKYPYMIKPKDCGKYYYAFCIEHTRYNKNNGYGVRLFGKGSSNNGTIQAYLEVKHDDWWWLKRDGESMKGIESKLLEFLNSSDIKALNEKLKSYQA